MKIKEEEKEMTKKFTSSVRHEDDLEIINSTGKCYCGNEATKEIYRDNERDHYYFLGSKWAYESTDAAGYNGTENKIHYYCEACG